MILRNVTARHGRCHLAPVARASLRQLTTAVESPTTLDGSPSLDTEAAEEVIRRRSKKGSVRVLGANSSTEHGGSRWAATRPMTEGGPVLTPAQQFAEFRRIQNNTKMVGSGLAKRYVPTELIHNPPGPEDVTLELLMASQTHLGHNTSLWNPANSRYIYGARHGVHIISLETTAAHLRRAARVVEEVSYNGGLILYVGTRKNQMEVVARAATLAGACHLFTRWTPGTITNRDKILATKPTKMINQNDQRLEDFGKFTSSERPLVPDLVVCLNPLENYTMLYECGLASVPTIGIIDTDADPSWVTYTIPANDDSLRSVAVIGGVLGRAGQNGRRRRLADAEKGQVTWSTSEDVKVFMRQEMTDAMLRRKEVMGRMQEHLAGFTEEESELLNSRLPSKPAKVGHDEMLGLMSEATQGQVEAVVSKVAEASVAEVEVKSDSQDEASAIVDEVAAHVNEAAAKTQEMVAKFMAAKGKFQSPTK